jgi:DnaD/phage-associated family protein
MYKILIADDEIKIREVIKEYALISGYEVFEAQNGIEAIEITKSEKIDAVILDIMMPKLDGYSALKEIKKTCNVPVIMLSARGEEYDKLRAFEEGVDDYVVKPFSPKEVMARLKVVISRNQSFDSDTFEKDGLKVDFTGRSVYVNGLKRELTPKEKSIVEKWSDAGLDIEYIKEAYNITVSKTQKASLNYCAKIVDNWLSNGIKTVENIKESEDAFKQKSSLSTFETDDFFEAALTRSYKKS